MRNLLPLCLIQKLTQSAMDRVHLLQHSWTEHIPTTLTPGMPLGEAISAHLDSGTHYQVTPPTLIECLSHPGLALTARHWLVWMPSSTCSCSEILSWAAVLCRSLSLPSLASHSPHMELTLGRFPAPILGCQPCSKSLACLPLSWSCVNVYLVWSHLLSWP